MTSAELEIFACGAKTPEQYRKPITFSPKKTPYCTKQFLIVFTEITIAKEQFRWNFVYFHCNNYFNINLKLVRKILNAAQVK